MATEPAFEAWLEDGDPAKRRLGLRLGAGALLALLAAGAALMWLRRGPAAAAPAAPQAWATAELRPLPTRVTTTGTVRLRTGAEVRVGAQVSGIVRQLNVAVGSHIARGAVIARLDPAPLEASVKEAQAQAAMDAVALGKAERDWQRGQALLAQGLIPAQQGEDLRWALQAARAKLALSRSQLAAATVALGYSIIRAPIAGTVASVSTQQGETVAAAFAAPTFVTIVADRALELEAMVDETDIGRVGAGDRVRFSVESFPGRELAAVVRRINPTPTVISGVVNYAVMASLARVPRFLRPGMTADIAIATGTRRALMVPDGAVQRIGNELYATVRRGGHAARVRITAGRHAPGWTEITSGLRAGERVALPGGRP
jgi:macrolide-specific efflux system membrane fusion protein